MPPVTKAGGSAFQKDVGFLTKDEDEEDDDQIAAGVVMVPDTVDLQHDFAREETIRDFADQFEAFVEAGHAGGGVMHAVWPDEWMDLERNEVLDEADEIGGEEVPAGAWVQEWEINHDDLWELILDDVISGYSIGAIDVGWNGPFGQDDDEVEDVDVPDEIDDEAMIWELIDGIIREVSAVDIPAVPDAEILDTKADANKRLASHLGNRDAFIEEALERGHTEAEAERLWDVLNEAVEADGSDEPGKQSVFTRAGKAFLSALTGDDGEGKEPASARTPTGPIEAGRRAVKEGRTLSQQNRHSLFATIDAAADVLEDAGVDHDIQRFTDRDDVEFDLSEHSAREWGSHDDDEDDDDDDKQAASTDNDASDGDTSDDTTMSNDNDGDGDDKSLAEKNAEQINELTETVEGLTKALTGPEEKTAEIDIDGETHEVSQARLKAALGVDEDAGVGIEDALETLQEKADRVDEVERRLDAMNRQSGVSTQLERNAEADGQDEEDGLDDLGKALS